MAALLDHIKAQIATQGPMSIASFMELALQHPEHGYYIKQDPLGRDGDFITAPEISQMFGEMIGLWCADVWRQLGKPESFALLELGPGRGTLMQDALRATAKISGFHAAVQLHLCESNKVLRKVQQEKLAEHLPVYVDDLSQLPDLPLIVVANEFFDALPIRQFERTFNGWQERMVGVANDELAFTHASIEALLMQLIPDHLREANVGSYVEVSLPSTAIFRQIAKHIMRKGGAALVIDYGYADAAGLSTLQAVSKHHYAEILQDPGDIDLTAHVDFGMLAKVASGQGAVVTPVTTQGDFLKNLGIDLRAAQLKQRANPQQIADLDAALDRLINPDQMGNLFKVLAISSPPLTQLVGF